MSDARFGYPEPAFCLQASQLPAESALTEKTKPGRFIDRQIRTAAEMGRDSRGILRNERQCLLPLKARRGCLFLNDMAEPAGGDVTVCKVDVVLLCITVAGD